MHLVTLGPREQVVVDIGDVAHHLDLVASIDKAAVQDVVGHVGGSVAEMCGVVGSNPADVDAHHIVDDEWRHFASRRVIDRHMSHRTTLASTAAKARPTGARPKVT